MARSWTKEQQTAISLPSSNILVSAGAGSGKTAVLTERIITLLKSGVNINELLILTFTNASAQDIKRQIRSAIEKEVTDGKENFKKQLDLLDTSDIGTFDSYVLSIAKRLHYKLAIESRIEIIDKNVLYLKSQEILSEVFENFYAKEDFNFINIINDFTNKDDLNIKEIVLKYYDKMANIVNRHRYLVDFISNYYNDERIEFYISSYHKLLLKNINLFITTINNLKLQIFDESYSEHLMDIERYLELFNKCNNYDDAYQVNAVGLSKLPRVKNNAEEKLIIQELKNSIKKYLNTYFRFPDQEFIKASLTKLKSYLKGFVKILIDYDAALNEYKKATCSYEFSDISRMVIRMFKKHPDSLLEYKNKYKEIMIDEYQDNNNVQEVFIGLLDNNNVYTVGDIKQSIYRFRNSNPELFKRRYQLYKTNPISGNKIDFTFNFRSRQEVIEVINTIFAPVMDSRLGGCDYQLEHLMKFANTTLYPSGNNSNYGGEVLEYLPQKEIQHEQEAFIMAQEINKLIDSKLKISKMVNGERVEVPIEFKDIAIITEKKKLLPFYQKVFNRFKIPTSSLSNLGFIKSNEIYALVNLCRLIKSYQDPKYAKLSFEHAFYAVARSYLFEIADQDIINALLESKNSMNPFNVLESNLLFNPIITKIKELANMNVTIADLLTETTIKFNCFANLIKLGDVQECQTKIYNFIDFFNQKSKSFTFSLDDFINYIDYLYKNNLDIEIKSNALESNSVKLISMHSSKGLEFPVVFLPHLYTKFVSDATDNFLYNDKFNLIAPVYINDQEVNTILKDLTINREQNELISEEIRLFYVAVTRAKEKVYFLKPLEEVKKNYFYSNGLVDYSCRFGYKSMNDILNSIYDRLTKYVSKEYLTIETNNSYKFPAQIVLPAINGTEKLEAVDLNLNVPLRKFHRAKILTFDELKTIEAGRKVHYELENHHNNFSYDYTIRKILRALGRENDLAKLRLYHELPFCYLNNGEEIRGVIDLLIVSEEMVYIVDYKLSNLEDDRYYDQLNRYQEFIATKFSQPIKLYLYSLLREEMKVL